MNDGPNYGLPMPITYHSAPPSHYFAWGMMHEGELHPVEVRELPKKRDWTQTLQIRANSHDPWRTITVTAPVFVLALFPKP